MRLYHHARIEKYPNDAQQAWLAVALGGIMAIIVSGIIVLTLVAIRC